MTANKVFLFLGICAFVFTFVLAGSGWADDPMVIRDAYTGQKIPAKWIRPQGKPVLVQDFYSGAAVCRSMVQTEKGEGWTDPVTGLAMGTQQLKDGSTQYVRERDQSPLASNP